MQRSFDDMGAPLSEVTFVVVDLETTGASANHDAITEIGAVKLRGGECLGTFQTLVNPGLPIPPQIVYLTGITEAMVLPAPTIDAALPAFLEFLGSTDVVVVGHNVRFDLSFLNEGLRRHHYPRLGHRFVDTCMLARRLVRDEVPNCKLGTLADHFRTARRPSHRALDDALATGEVLHSLLERAGSLGVLALEDLLELPTVHGHPQLAKLKLASALPRQPGVYLFKDGGGRVLYVGKAVDLRRRVRSYFTGDERRKVGQLLRETATIDHIVTGGELEASVLEVRLIHELLPRFNRQSKHWRKYAYLKLTLDERFPRLSVVRQPKDGDGCLYLGPLGSTTVARLVAEAIETAVPIRRCTARVGAKLSRSAPCAPAQLGVATCPCSGEIAEAGYRAIVDQVVAGITHSPELLLGPLEQRMGALAAAARFEEAAAMRDRASAVANALARQRRLDGLRRAGRLVVEVDGEGRTVLQHGQLVDDAALPFDIVMPVVMPGVMPTLGPLPRHLADELSTVASYLDTRAARVRIVACDGEWASPLPRLPRYEPRRLKRSA